MEKKNIIIIIGTIFTLLLMAGILIACSKNYSFFFFVQRKSCHYQLENKELYFFASRHSIDPKDIMFDCLEKKMNQFQPDLILVEGGANKAVYTKEESYSHGESSFAVSLASEKNIPAEDIEPPFEKQIQHLMETYNVEDILSMYIIRQIGAIEILPEENTEETTKKDMRTVITNVADNLINAGLPFSYDSFEDITAIINTHLPEEINESNWLSLDCNGLYALNKGEGLIHDIYVEVYLYRNTYLVDLIKEKKEQYDKIFVVMGGQHLDDTKDDLKALYSENE